MNNEVLDVAIGLTFIYLLYSLLATTISELVAVIFTYRSKMLERGIEQMLDGKNFRYRWWSKLWMFFLMFFKETADWFAKPKVVSGENDNATEGKSIKLTFNERAISYCKDANVTILDNTQFCKKATLFAAEITSHALYKRSSEDSGNSKKPAYLAADVFSDILIDVLGGDAERPTLLMDIAKTVKEKIEPLNPETAKILNIYIKQANGDLQRFKQLIENWYDETMKRVSGWYKRQSFKVLLIIGFVLALIFNVDTIGIVHKLSTNKTVRDALVKDASAYIKTHTNPDGAKAATGTPAKPDSAKSSLCPPDKPDTSFAAIKEGVEKIKDLYHESIEEQNTTLGLGWGDYGFKNDSLARDTIIKCLKVEIEVARQPTKKDSLSKELAKQKRAQPGRGDIGYKLIYLAKHLSVEGLIGWLITALAISLGAPFWFDLLNKFINLRASGKKPEEDQAAASKTAALNSKPAPNSFG